MSSIFVSARRSFRFAILFCVAGTLAVGLWGARASNNPPGSANGQATDDRSVKVEAGRVLPTEDLDSRDFADAELRDFFTVEFAVEIVATDNEKAPRTLRREEVTPLSLTRVGLRDGLYLDKGEMLVVGDVIVRAVLQNDSERAISLMNSETGEFFELLPGEIVIVAAAENCTVVCGSGTYSCCNAPGGTSICRCKPNAMQANCEAGGPGSSSCSITAAQ